MANEQFDLGEALGSYEQAKADRDFYLNMVQQGNNQREGAYWASPIAAYLGGVANAKVALSRQKIQQAQDERQEKKDAAEVAKQTKSYQGNLLNNLVKVTEAANQGEISQGAAAGIVGHIVKAMGYTPVNYAADKGILTYQDNEGNEYEHDLSQKWTSKKQAKAESAKGSTPKYTTLSSFNSTHKTVAAALEATIGKQRKLDKLSQSQVQAYIEGAEGLSPADKKQVQPKIDELVKLAGDKKWTFKSPVQNPQSVKDNFNNLWDSI